MALYLCSYCSRELKVARLVRLEVDDMHGVGLCERSTEGLAEPRLFVRPVDEVCGVVELLVHRVNQVAARVEQEDVVVSLRAQECAIRVMVPLVHSVVLQLALCTVKRVLRSCWMPIVFNNTD